MAEKKKPRGPQVHHFQMPDGEEVGIVFSYNAIVDIADALEGVGVDTFGEDMRKTTPRDLRTIMHILMEAWRRRDKPDREPFSEYEAGDAFDALGGAAEGAKIIFGLMGRSAGATKAAVAAEVAKIDAASGGEEDPDAEGNAPSPPA